MAWVEEAYGSKASLLCGYFHWVSGATDNAIYPALFLSYVSSYLASSFGQWTRFLFTVSITVILSVINYLGLDVVGHLSIVICVLSMSPFVVLFLCSLTRIEPSRWLKLPEVGVEMDDNNSDGFFPEPNWGGVHWRALLNNLFWNLNSFDVGASFAGEVHDAEHVFPRAMFMSVVMVVASYLIPLLAALGAVDSHQQDWKEGYFASISVDIAGPWLGIWMVFAAAVSNIALYEAEMSGDAYQLMGMADRGLIPKLFTKRSRFGTPKNGIILNTLVIILMSVADFEQLVEMLNFAYSFSLLMELTAFIKLRIEEPERMLFKLRFNLLAKIHDIGVRSLAHNVSFLLCSKLSDPTEYLSTRLDAFSSSLHRAYFCCT
jgi:amino acid transporter